MTRHVALQENPDPNLTTHYGFVLSKGSGDTADMGTMKRTKIFGKEIFNWSITFKRGTAVAHWLRCCATNQKVAGSIPAGVIGIFH